MIYTKFIFSFASLLHFFNDRTILLYLSPLAYRPLVAIPFLKEQTLLFGPLSHSVSTGSYQLSIAAISKSPLLLDTFLGLLSCRHISQYVMGSLWIN
jgi:hypothetical protein